jgi:hypothetical protein
MYVWLYGFIVSHQIPNPCDVKDAKVEITTVWYLYQQVRLHTLSSIRFCCNA